MRQRHHIPKILIRFFGEVRRRVEIPKYEITSTFSIIFKRILFNFLEKRIEEIQVQNVLDSLTHFSKKWV